MTSTRQPRADVEPLRTAFRERYEAAARFREDRALAVELATASDPLFLAASDPHVDLHDVFALLSALCGHAAELGASASVAVIIPTSILSVLAAAGHQALDSHREELMLVAVEAYCAARDERAQAHLRKQVADSQVAVELAPQALAIFLAGPVQARHLAAVLAEFARRALRADARACLLDLSQLAIGDEEQARCLGDFCAEVLSLGVQIAVVTRDEQLVALFRSWSLGPERLSFHAEYASAQLVTLRAAGLEMRRIRPWLRIFFPRRSDLVR